MIQRLDSFFARCQNEGCEDWNEPETYYTDEARKDDGGEYVQCRACGNRIYLDE